MKTFFYLHSNGQHVPVGSTAADGSDRGGKAQVAEHAGVEVVEGRRAGL